ncbi:uncharacterized protein B0T23DRAFT_326409 [Neurospora hispaniola]|uniref:Uncharacterized protein n=1 Tax=Neurospora hispaniola TaxID=588809 RepID=A0AAJ0HZB1_9PEZI|nr:hypothetical protein B0T23DRAFT_326409 [Neurospora hispaniola]
MVVRIPAAGMTEYIFFGAAGVGTLAPLAMGIPGAEERVARATAKWAPRWERNINYFTNHVPVERGIQRITPPVERAVHRVEHELPLEKAAVATSHVAEKSMKPLEMIKHNWTME